MYLESSHRECEDDESMGIDPSKSRYWKLIKVGEEVQVEDLEVRVETNGLIKQGWL